MENINDYLDKVDSSWDKDLIIRYLVRVLAPFFRKDLNYFLLTSKEQLDCFSRGYKPEFPNVICTTLCEFYQNVFREFGINSKIINANHSELEGRVPLYALIVEGTFCFYYINPLKDLYVHQLGIASNAFGYFPPHYNHLNSEYPYLQFLDISYIDSLDEKLGIKRNDSIFTDNVPVFKNFTKYRVLNGFSKSTPMEEVVLSKLRHINDCYINVGEVNGLIERSDAYKYFFRNTFTAPEKRYVELGLNLDSMRIKVMVKAKDYPILFEEEKEDGVYRLVRKN